MYFRIFLCFILKIIQILMEEKIKRKGSQIHFKQTEKK